MGPNELFMSFFRWFWLRTWVEGGFYGGNRLKTNSIRFRSEYKLKYDFWEFFDKNLAIGEYKP